MLNIAAILAEELSSTEKFINDTVTLLDDGATVPFISRYRKEMTGGLDDIQLRTLESRLTYLRELEERKIAILKSIESQNKLDPSLKQQIENTESKTLLEDIYRPYMPKRRNKAQQAREAGLEPLTIQLLENQDKNPESLAAAFINKDHNIDTIELALEGAKQILMEVFSEDTGLNTELRDFLWQRVKLKSAVTPGKEQEGEKFSNYFDAVEAIAKIPSHRALALFRGRNEEFLQINLVIDEAEETNVAMNGSSLCANKIIKHFNINTQQQTGQWLAAVALWTWKVKLSTRLDTELKLQLKESAEQEAINVFSHNLNDLLMAAPAGPQVTIGLDPGFRSGVKIAVVDNTGKYIDDAVIYPHQPQNQYSQAIQTLADIIKKHNVKLVSIGNGTASRETDRLVNDLIKQHSDINIQKIVVSEAGASVYSASPIATEEFPNLDVTVRGAISIARRLQDPLAELVKIDPKAIGVGQYQHDVNQSKLGKGLHNVVEDCVNSVGVDINMASAQLLSYVSGFNTTLAKNVVEYRDNNGKFSNRNQLKKVARLGDKAFQQSAGFLKIMNGDTPLDSSSVHPEAYPIVKEIVKQSKHEITQLIGNQDVIQKLVAKDFANDQFGIPTIKDIFRELEKPGRDPRPDFKSATFKEGIEKIGDLKTGMILEGVVTNITNFGAFIDIGVHQDGLVHISAMADKFVKDPHQIVKTGDVVKVKVMEVETQRKRIALSMRLTEPSNNFSETKKPNPKNKTTSKMLKKSTVEPSNAFAAAFSRAKQNS